MITSADLIALSPLVVLAAGASLILLVIAFWSDLTLFIPRLLGL